MLLDSFFRIGEVSRREEQNAQGVEVVHYQTILTINPAHPIFAGHFPGNPVVPGVCQIQMIMETFRFLYKQPVRLLESNTVKFLTMINPEATPAIELNLAVKQIETGSWSLQASLNSEGTAFIKFSGKVIPE